jgi:sulfate adenylyltransferase large subunit
MDALKFVIVGHVDHGKSTLIGRLLYDTNSLAPDKIEEIRKTSADLGRDTEFAYLLDHLEEERQQGITIDTTQVFFKTARRQYVIIDAPGHVEFVKNMITGASQAEAAVLIVDVKEGVREQTKRHAYILSLLGLGQVVAVFNKMDLVDYSEQRFTEVRTDLDKFLASIGLQPIYWIPICALKGENIASRSETMSWYTGPSFLESLDALKSFEPASDKPLIFPVQDIYKLDDKRIIAGKIEAGVLQTGQRITVLPSRQTTLIKTIEKFPDSVDSACAGESIGVTLQDPLFVNRGDVVCQPGAEPTLTNTFGAVVFWMAKKPFQKDEKVTVRCSTQQASSQVNAIHTKIDSSTLQILEEDANTLQNLEVGRVTIETKNPIAIKPFSDVRELGRFVFVRDDDICAGGIISTG